MDIVVGTAGHIDHGKTALVKALTGTDTDRLPEEKKRGITIDLGFAELEHNGIHFGFVDVPGHERFVKNMLAGASGIDAVMLVIAADEGVMPQTREHFQICRLLGVNEGIIALTKSDLASEEITELVREDVRDLVAGSFLETAEIVSVSAKTGSGLDKLRDSLAAVADRLKDRDRDIIARLAVDRSFTKKGFGTVVTGTLASGSLNEGDDLDLFPEGRNVRVRGLQTHGRVVKTASAGNRTAVNLAGIDHDEVTRGMLLAEKGVLRPTLSFDAKVEALADIEKTLRSRQRVRVYIGSAEVLARISVLNEKGEIGPGGSGFVQFRVESPVVAIYGERFVVRSYSPQITIAGGTILDNFPPRHRRKAFDQARQFLDQLSTAGDQARLLMRFVENAGPAGIESSEIRARTAWSETVLRAALEGNAGSIVSSGHYLVTSASLEGLKSAIMQRVEKFHKDEPLAPGIGREALRSSARGDISSSIADAAIDELAREGKVKIDGDLISAANREQKLTPDEARAKERLGNIYSAAKLEPPKLDDALSGETKLGRPKARQVFQMLIDSGVVTKVTEEFYFASDAIKDLRTRLSKFAAASADKTIDVAQFKELAGVSRKFAIPLLEYFDREKVTVRSGDKRLILK